MWVCTAPLSEWHSTTRIKGRHSDFPSSSPANTCQSLECRNVGISWFVDLYKCTTSFLCSWFIILSPTHTQSRTFPPGTGMRCISVTCVAVQWFENKSLPFWFCADSHNFSFPSVSIAHPPPFQNVVSLTFSCSNLLLFHLRFGRQENFDENFGMCWRSVGADSDALRIARFFLTHQSRV